MDSPRMVSVALDQELVKQLMDGLYNGAKGKALKVVISTNGNYHIESKELRILIETDQTGKHIQEIRIHNEKQAAVVSAEDLQSFRLAELADKVLGELKEKYSPVFHSLADNIVVFGRAYGNP